MIERASALGRELGPVVVVAVGYNDYENTYEENIEETLRVLSKAGVERVLWATLIEQRQSWARMNEMITAAAKKHPEMTVLDWNARARGKDAWLQPDGDPPHSDRRAEHGDDDQRGPGHARRRLPAAGARAPVVDRREDAAKGPGGTCVRDPVAGARRHRPVPLDASQRLAPPGLRLTTAGVVTGKPSQAGRYRFVARVVDRAGAARTGTFVLGVTR